MVILKRIYLGNVTSLPSHVIDCGVRLGTRRCKIVDMICVVSVNSSKGIKAWDSDRSVQC